MDISELALKIDPDGTIWFEGKRLQPRIRQRGYHSVTIPVHRLVAYAFHGHPPTPKHVCHHIDSNPRNNAADNLEWLTQSENIRRRKPNRKLTDVQVRAILAQKPEPVTMLRDLADAFGVSLSTVSAIRTGRNWKTGWRKTNRGILTAEQVQRIQQWRAPVVTAPQMAIKYKVSTATILNIWHGRYPVQ